MESFNQFKASYVKLVIRIVIREIQSKLCCQTSDFKNLSFSYQNLFKKPQMVEEIINNVNKPKIKTARPKAVYYWTVFDVQKWLRRHCSDYYPLYWDKFQQHDITGRALVRINENTLLRLGITNKEHREAIWREIMKQRLKTDIMEIRDLERRNDFYD